MTHLARSGRGVCTPENRRGFRVDRLDQPMTSCPQAQATGVLDRAADVQKLSWQESFCVLLDFQPLEPRLAGGRQTYKYLLRTRIQE